MPPDSSLERYARPNTFEIDLGAIRRCTAQIRDRIGPGVYFIATLKANAYGFGLMPAARTVLAAGADAISLVSLDDAIALRQAGITAPILVYAGSVPDEHIVQAAADYGLIATLHSEESLAAFAVHAPRAIDVAVKVDVGQERIGVPAEKAVDFIRRVVGHPRLRLRIVNAHPNVPAKGRSQECLAWQYQRFVEVCNGLARAGIAVPYRVLASSKILRLTGTSMALNAVDPGAALFSSLLRADDEACQPLRGLKSRLIQVREVSRSEFVAEVPFTIKPNMRMGVIPIGYSDGMHRLHCGEVLVRGERVAILASPALEYTRIDLTNVPRAAVGDEVVIIGRQGQQRIAPEEVVAKQFAGRESDLALEVRASVARSYVDSTAALEQAPAVSAVHS
jgi:alanine racemase